MNIRISATREMADARVFVAVDQPHRRDAVDPLDPRLECPLGRLRLSHRISESEYRAGCRWRNIYSNWLHSIGAPNPNPSAIDYGADVHDGQEFMGSGVDDDERDEAIAQAFRAGEQVLKRLGPRAFHAVSAIAVYEETEELGDFQFTARAAQRGFAALAEHFGC